MMNMGNCDKDACALAEQELDEVAGGRSPLRYKADCRTCGWCGDTFEKKYQAESQAMDHKIEHYFLHDVHVNYATS